MDKITFRKGTMVKVDGIPFTLENETILVGKASNVSLIRPHKSLGVPSVLNVAQPETSETARPSSESM